MKSITTAKYLTTIFLLFVSLLSYAQNKIAPPPPPPPAPKTESVDVFKVVEQMPRFPGCENQGLKANELQECSKNKLLSYIVDNLQYPEEAKESNVEGRVIIQFVINKTGKMENIKLLRDLGAGCGAEAMRLMNQMANEITWIPGKQRGKAVKVMYTLPISFKL